MTTKATTTIKISDVQRSQCVETEGAVDATVRVTTPHATAVADLDLTSFSWTTSTASGTSFDIQDARRARRLPRAHRRRAPRGRRGR
jgi:hypothetical protein